MATITGDLTTMHGVLTGELSVLHQTLVGTLSAHNVDLTGTLDILPSAQPEAYEGEHVVVPKMYEQTLETKNKFVREDITVLQIPYFETSNEAGGTTVYIAMEV